MLMILIMPHAALAAAQCAAAFIARSMLGKLRAGADTADSLVHRLFDEFACINVYLAGRCQRSLFIAHAA